MAKLVLILSFLLAVVSCQCGSIFNQLDKEEPKTPAVASVHGWADVVEQAIPAVVKIRIIPRSKTEEYKVWVGTGFIISPDGLIATSAHLFSNQSEHTYVQVETIEGLLYDVETAYVSLRYDIAFIHIEVEDSPYLVLESRFLPRQGDPVLTIGHAMSMLEWTVADGIVSYTNRQVGKQPNPWLQITASVNFGCSGGPVLNEHGRVVGLIKGLIPQGFEVYIAAPVQDLYQTLAEIAGVKYDSEEEKP